MMVIKVSSIKKEKNRIEVKFEQTGLDKYLSSKESLFWEYEENIETVPDSIAIIPFISDLLPLVFVMNAELIVNDIDKNFYEAITRYREGYKKLAPMMDFGGTVTAGKIVDTEYQTEKDCLLFSGGVDAANSLVMNENSIGDCITIWGADIDPDNEEGWNVLQSSIEDTLSKFGKKTKVVHSNFRSCLNEKNLTEAVAKSKDSWWHGFQHGIALLGCSAPLAYLNRYSRILIASSFTAEFRPLCASDPYTDNCFKVASSGACHDGFEFDRCQKIKNIADRIKEKGITINLHVCWESNGGSNCGVCEKCLRSYLNCRAVGVDSSNLGIVANVPMDQIRKMYLTQNDYKSESIRCRLGIIQKNIKKTYNNSVPEDLRWITEIDPDKVSNSLYWRIKRLYRKIKAILNV